MEKPEKKTRVASPSLDLKTIVGSFNKFIGKHGAILFIALSLGLLTYCVYSVNSIVSMPDDMEYYNEKKATRTKTNFDKQTIEKINQLKAPDQSNNLTLPTGRINPFSE